MKLSLIKMSLLSSCISLSTLTFLILVCTQIPCCSSYRGKVHPLTYQRQIDYLDVEQYFRNARLMRIQIMCIIYDEPCDFVGRWLKRTCHQKNWLIKKARTENALFYRVTIYIFFALFFCPQLDYSQPFLATARCVPSIRRRICPSGSGYLLINIL